ncbi:hypothetical protein RchiOBHm_Chr6g0273181 [Rosa chinensis]|uniref:Uncharacterized protein n=1 Tax=Rosa chinensis TaxID=74649 RepID=A0A2P6PRF5_ROSCH|nr:hypothetical protein RchiOBHm_Chr6g0273181 [Rosa chinensis]
MKKKKVLFPKKLGYVYEFKGSFFNKKFFLILGEFLKVIMQYQLDMLDCLKKGMLYMLTLFHIPIAVVKMFS